MYGNYEIINYLRTFRPLTRLAKVSRRPILQFSARNHLVVTFKLSTIDSQAFPVAAAKIWNALPGNVVSASSVDLF